MTDLNYPRPHDLLWHDGVHGLSALSAAASLPAWFNPNWPVAVRRAPLSEDGLCVPVGLRGLTRSVRFPALLSHSSIKRCLTPDALIEPDLWLLNPEIGNLPALNAFHVVLKKLSSTDLVWGPTGSVGFALATGTAVINADSDLDLVLRSDERLSAEQIKLLQHALTQTECRIDLQIDSGFGGFSFVEWVRDAGRVLLKTETGPVLTDDPWAHPIESNHSKKTMSQR